MPGLPVGWHPVISRVNDGGVGKFWPLVQGACVYPVLYALYIDVWIVGRNIVKIVLEACTTSGL